MARKNKKKQSRRRFTGYNLWDLGVAYGQASILTDAAFNMNPIEFVLGDFTGRAAGTGTGFGADRVSFKELITGWSQPHGGSSALAGKSESQIVWSNIQNNWADAAIKSVGLGIGSKVAKKLLRQPRASINKLLKAGGLNTVVRV